MKVEFSWACVCGAVIQARIAGISHTQFQGLYDIWKQMHEGRGHAPVDPKTAHRIRRENESKAS